MTTAVVIELLLKYGPSVLPVAKQIAEWVRAGKTEVTPEDIAVLIAYGNKKAEGYLAEAGGAPVAK